MKVIEKMFGCGAHMCNYKNIRSLVPTSGYNFDCKWTVENILDEIKRSDLLITWETITVKAKWEWIRWVRSTQQAKTRATRISAACDKLVKGMKRPCCFVQTRCSIPELSKNGKLIIKV